MFPALERNIKTHWNQAVHSLTLNVQKIFHDFDPDLYKECLQKFEQDESKEGEVTAGREATWRRLEELAAKKATSSEAVLVGKALTRKSAGQIEMEHVFYIASFFKEEFYGIFWHVMGWPRMAIS